MATISQTSPDNFSIQDYTFEDYDVVPNFEVTSLFQPEEDLVEYFIYDANSNLIHSEYKSTSYSFTQDPSITNLGGYSTINIDPEKDLSNLGFDVGQYNIVYNFFEPQLSSNSNLKFYLKEISSDRTELRLASNNLKVTPEVFKQFSQKLQGENYFNEFYLNFGDNQVVIAVNALQEGEDILIKLYEPLPLSFSTKSTCWVTIKIADPVAYNVSFIQENDVTPSVPYLKGPNTNIQIKSEINNSTDLKSYEELISSNLTSSYQQVNNLLNQKSISINVDYTDYSNFIYFSSAEQRLLNFYEKVSLIESSSNQLNSIDNQITGSTSSSYYVSGSKSYHQNIIDNTIKNFDGYEYFLYFDSGSKSWPKSNSTYPYTLYSTGSSQVLNWLGNSNESSVYYGGEALSASRFDNDNINGLTNLIPEYIIDDPQNSGYQLFIEMIGQHFDSIWVYIKDVTNKFDADNRLNYGISKDLVAQAVRDFGLKIYQNQFSQEDLFSAFLGITPSGSLLPSTGSEVIDTYVTASSDVVPLDDVNKAIYKRLYHNLPYLLNKKGTIQGIKALIASYGIPNTILRVSEFGGKDRDNSNDWDYWYNKFGYSFYTSGSTFLSSSFSLNSDWGAASNVPGAVEFRFKSEGIPTVNYSQSLWSTDGGVELQLLYNGSGSASGSYSGSVVDPYNTYGYLNFYPDYSTPTNSASVYLPFFDEGWWSVLINSSSAGYELFAKNRLYIGEDASLIGFQSSSSTNPTEPNWGASTLSYFASGSQTKFSGSLQEIRYYKTELSESVFDDYVMNQLSSEGNSLNSSPLDLTFRAPLGSELDTSSRESVHPKITGSWTITQSFSSDSRFAFSADPTFVPGTEYIFLDQPAVGIRNRITDKVKIGDQILPSGSGQVLSQYQSVEQQLAVSQSFTDNVNLLEVAFSPQNEINDDIIEQIGYFNIGEYIGDRRYATSDNDRYEDLYKLASEYFEKYTHNYDVYDYIRLIKYFDNSLFKMIKDFVPAKTSLQSGVVIKQHLLERNRIPEFQLSHERNDYSGSISVGSIEGGAGGSVNRLNPTSSLSSYFTQSYGETLNTIAGAFNVTHSSQDEFYNGEYSGSTLTVTTQSLNPECWAYLHSIPDSTNHPVAVFNTTSSAVTQARFIDSNNTLMQGSSVYFLFDGTNVNKIRISKEIDEASVLSSLTSISTVSTDLGSKTYNLAKFPLENATDFIYDVLNPDIGTPTYAKNTILDHSFSLEADVRLTPFLISGSGIKPFQISDSSVYNGCWFYPFTSNHVQRPLSVTQNPHGLTATQVWDENNSSIRYSYINDSLMNISPGQAKNVAPRNFYTSLDYDGGNGWSGQITLAMVKLQGSRVETVWRSNLNTWYNAGVSPLGVELSDRWDLVTSQTEADLTANYNNINDPYYMIGFITGSTTKTGNGTVLFGQDLWVSISQSSYPDQPNGTLGIIKEDSNPSGFTNSNCDVLQGNSEADRASGFYMDVDYSTNASVAVNSSAILNNTAIKADVQDSNYTLARHKNPRYNGSRTTSQYINKWSEGDTNTYGKSATADSKKTYYAYFDFINGLSPELKDKSIAHIQFLVDEDGNSIPPDSSSLALTQGTFQTDEYVFVNLNDPTRFEVPMNQLNGKKQIVRGGYRVDALLYSDSGSSFVNEIGFDTGSFSVTNYEFGADKSSTFTITNNTYTTYNWSGTTKTNTQWDLSTDKFTFTSDTDSPVKFQTTVTYLFNTTGNVTVYLVKNWTSGAPTSAQILDSEYFGYSGLAQKTISLNSGFQDFENGDTVQVLLYTSVISAANVTFNNTTSDVFTSTNQINPNGVVSTPYWSVDTTNTNWITASADLSGLYGSRQLDVIPYDGTTSNPEFDPIIQDFTTLVGDEIRFKGAEAYSYMIQDVLLPENQIDGKLKLKLDSTLPNTVTGSLDHFLLRRYVDDASYVILDAQKPLGSTSPGTMRPEFVTDQLDTTFPRSSQAIIKSIT